LQAERVEAADERHLGGIALERARVHESLVACDDRMSKG
jgi:hypothetical protein